MPDANAYKTPGQLIEECLAAKGWTKRVLALVLDIDETVLNKLIAAKRAVDAPMALKLAGVLGVTPGILLEIQRNYDLKMAELVARPDPGVQARAQLFGSLPVSEMVKRGWLTGVENARRAPDLERALCRFFDAEGIEQIEALPYAAKRANTAEPPTKAQLAWLYRVRQIAADMMAPRFTQGALKEAIGSLEGMRVSVEATRRAPRALMDAGVRFLVVESLPGAKIDGVCFWLDAASPVIALSLRLDRIDNFWFVLRHEIEHAIGRHGQAAATVDADLDGEGGEVGAGVPEQERQANAAAAEFCVPQAMMEKFMARKAPFFAERDIIGFARVLRVHPGLVAGQLQRRTRRYDLFRKHLAKVRSYVREGALVDGWGDVAPVGA